MEYLIFQTQAELGQWTKTTEHSYRREKRKFAFFFRIFSSLMTPHHLYDEEKSDR